MTAMVFSSSAQRCGVVRMQTPAPRTPSSPAAPAPALRRRALLGAGILAVPSLLAAAPPSMATVFEGEYNDPSHPGCLRRIDAKGNVYGADPVPIKPGAPCKPGEPTTPWQLTAEISKDDKTILIDFDPIDEVKLGIPSKGEWTGVGLQLPNGLWTKK